LFLIQLQNDAMKKLLPVLFLFSFVVFESAHAQNAAAVTEQQGFQVKSEKQKAIERQYFGCAKCDFVSKVAGTCPYDQIPLVRVGNYYCPVLEGYTSDKAGDCPQHKIPLREMMFKYIMPDKSQQGKPGVKPVW